MSWWESLAVSWRSHTFWISLGLITATWFMVCYSGCHSRLFTRLGRGQTRTLCAAYTVGCIGWHRPVGVLGIIMSHCQLLPKMVVLCLCAWCLCRTDTCSSSCSVCTVPTPSQCPSFESSYIYTTYNMYREHKHLWYRVHTSATFRPVQFDAVWYRNNGKYKVQHHTKLYHPIPAYCNVDTVFQ